MAKIIDPESWKAKDDLILSSNAEKVIKSNENYVVTSGPGSGKTELLAQRASCLLETNICSNPRKILAISFKKDAAQNIADRVEERNENKFKNRFVSKTYHAFAKMLVDNFRKAIPENYRPKADYNLLTHLTTAEKEQRIVKFSAELSEKFSLRHGIQEIAPNEFWNNSLIGNSLPINNDFDNVNDWLASKVWDDLLNRNENKSELTFSMLIRLAEYLLKRNPYILKSLRATYSHVFLDEFQDTTYPQYDLIKACFFGSGSTLTAVGDEKQRIMGWAGAMPDAFEIFAEDFNANEIELYTNYRSAPKLIEIQKVFSNYLSGEQPEIKYSDKWDENDGICEVWVFDNSRQESKKVAEAVADFLEAESLNPREICILTKMKPKKYTKLIIEELNSKGIKAREESGIQPLLAEELTKIILALINLAVSIKAPDDYYYVIETLKFLKAYDNETQNKKVLKLENNLSDFNKKLDDLLKQVTNEADILNCINEIITFIGEANLKSKFPQYQNNNWFDEVREKLLTHLLAEYKENRDWIQTVANLRGENTVPIMTTHKSKGLEFDTIFFVGLEDSAFWTIENQRKEDTSTFFVAFSRAEKRVIITFSKRRNFDSHSRQRAENVGSIYRLLAEAGLVEKRDF